MIPMKKTLVTLLMSGLAITASVSHAGNATYAITLIPALGEAGYNLQSLNSNGQAVGYGNNESGLIYDSGVYTTIIPPNVTNKCDTRLSGINDSGQIIGYYTDYGNEVIKTTSFVYINKTFIPIHVPNSVDTFAWGIANNGLIVGSFYDPIELRERNFVYNGSAYQVLPDFPNNVVAHYRGINSSGVLVGYYDDPPKYFGTYEHNSHGVIFKNGMNQAIDYFPNTNGHTYLNSINDSGQITGNADDSESVPMPGSTNSLGFIYDHNTYTTVKWPDSSHFLYSRGITSTGLVFGSLDSNNYFIATPSTLNSPCHPNVIFNFWSHELIMQDVLVAGVHYYAKLTDQGGYNFKLTDAHPVDAGTCAVSEVIQYANNSFTIPSVLAYGSDYKITLVKNKDNDLFTITNYSTNPSAVQ
jgi:hypothetical protein